MLADFLPGFSASSPWVLPWSFWGAPDTGKVAWFFGPRTPRSLMVFLGARPLDPGSPKSCLVFWLLRPLPFHGFFGPPAVLGVPQPWAFHGLFGRSGRLPAAQDLANFSADFGPVDPGFADFLPTFLGGFDC